MNALALAREILDPPEPDRAFVGIGEARGIQVEVVSSLAGLDALAADWMRLQRLSGPTSVFQSFSLTRVWARHFMSGEQRRRRLHLGVVREAGAVVLILPVVVAASAGLRIARLAGDPIGQYADLLADPAAAGSAAFKTVLDSLRAAGVDVLILRRVRADSHLLRLGAADLRPVSAPAAAPFADLAAFADYGAFLKSLSKSMRKGLRHRHHQLEKAGDVQFDILQGGAEARRVVQEAISLKRRWLVQQGAMSTAFLQPATRECLLDLAESGGETGAVVMRLRINDAPAAIRFGFEYQGCYFAYLAAYDEAFAGVAPGKMLTEFYISKCHERGLRRVDMLPPSDRHKTDWCQSSTAVCDYALPLTRQGMLYTKLYMERLRPTMQRAWGRLPDGVRSMAAALFVSI